MTGTRKLMAATIAGWVLALAFASVPAVSAGPNELEPMRCEASITFDTELADPHWIGTLTGCALAGAKVEFWERWADNYVVGATEHFFEDMVITIGDDTIAGYDAGVWNFATLKFRANGWVTDATGDWAYLAGYKVHEMGYTTPLADVIYGTGTFTLVPP